MPDTSKPWVLVRKGKPNIWFHTLSDAKSFFDALRFNWATKDEAVIFGPGKVCWRCRPQRWAVWVQDFGDRRKERADVMGDEETAENAA